MSCNPRNASYQPTTFLERGASVPFTTPMLTGTRVRPAERAGLELIVPNPSGGRGAYILPWTDLRSLCRPTVHDVLLTERIAALRNVTPATIRTAARKLAVEGSAGRAAGAAAAAALAADAQSCIITNFHLLLLLVQQEEPAGASTVPPDAESPAELEKRARRTIAAIAPRLRQDSETVAASLEDLAELFDPVGLGKRANQARLPHAIAMLKLLRKEVQAFPADGDEDVPGLAQMITDTADITLGCAEKTLVESRKLAAPIFNLLTEWQADTTKVSRELARTDWLMDGWERICALWSVNAGANERRAALSEIATLLPVIPLEAGDWVNFRVEVNTAVRLHRLVTGHEDWRTGVCVQDTVARNEALLAA